MRNHAVASLVSLALLLLACDEDKKKGLATPSAAPASASAPATTTAASAAASASAAPSASAQAAKPLADRLKCKELMPGKTPPGPLRDMNVGQPPAACPECGPTCSLIRENNPLEGVSVVYVCNEKFDRAAADRKIEELKKTLKKTAPVTEFGRGGVGGQKESGLFYDVLVYDDDSDCSVAVSWMRGKREDVVLAAKYALAGVKQADLR